VADCTKSFWAIAAAGFESVVQLQTHSFANRFFFEIVARRGSDWRPPTRKSVSARERGSNPVTPARLKAKDLQCAS